MGLKDFFADLHKQLSKHRYLEFSRKNLAATVSPFIPAYNYDETNEHIANGFEDIKDWVRIAYDRESDKGTLYKNLMKALDHFIKQIKEADEQADSITFEKDHVEKLRDATCQVIGARVYLETSAKMQGKHRILPDKHGKQLAVPLIQPYNRPNDSHLVASCKVRSVGKALDRLLAGLPVERSGAPVIRHAP